MSIHPVLFLESPIVQICEHDHLLLVSNYNKCIICNTDTEEFKQVGWQFMYFYSDFVLKNDYILDWKSAA